LEALGNIYFIFEAFVKIDSLIGPKFEI